MRLKELEASGGIISDEPIKKSVVWTDPSGKEVKFDVLVKRSSYADIELRMLAPDDQSKSALTISQSVVLADTGEPFPYEMAARIEPTLAQALLKVIREVNSRDQEAAEKN